MGKNNKEIYDEILPRFTIAIDDKHKFDFIIIFYRLKSEFINSS